MIPPKPEPLPVRPTGIPVMMKTEHRWVAWSYAWVESKSNTPARWTKVPFIPATPQVKASPTKPDTWGAFSEALATYHDGKCDGIGFVLGDGWVGFDADGESASEHVQLLNTYTEYSPSGDGGIHSICRGEKPGTACRTGHLELYDRDRYFTVTGHHVPGTPATVEERTTEIAALYAQLFSNVQGKPAAPPVGGTARTMMTDDALIATARAATNGAKFRALWEGDATGYTSPSEVDMALCAMLAYWSNGDAVQMDRLFRGSKLMRPKWDEARGDSTWGAYVISTAIAKSAKGSAGMKEDLPQLTIRRASAVPDEKLERRFGGRFVRGAFGLLCGPGEGGKGMLFADLSARFTTGEPFPGETSKRSPVNVVMCVTEDSMGRVKSRLRTAGADLDRVFFVQGPEVRRGGLTMPSPMMLDDDAGGLVRHAKQVHAEVLILETMVEHFGDRGGKLRRSTNNEADVRRALAPFRAVCAAAELYGLAAIHPRKSVDGSIDNSISGSAAFQNVTRATHHVYRDPADESDDPARLLFTSKANYLRHRPQTLRFRIKSWDEHLAAPCGCPFADCGHEGRVVWEADLFDDRTAEDLWKLIAERHKPRGDIAVKEAEAFLQGLMKDGEIAMPPEEIHKLASVEGLSIASVKQAKANLRLVSRKQGFPAVVVAWQAQGS
jgi:putative DNA primase/helicase